jgi:hypothetical protein
MGSNELTPTMQEKIQETDDVTLLRTDRVTQKREREYLIIETREIMFIYKGQETIDKMAHETGLTGNGKRAFRQEGTNKQVLMQCVATCF